MKYLYHYIIKLANTNLKSLLDSKAFEKEIYKAYFPKIKTEKHFKPDENEVHAFNKRLENLKEAVLHLVPKDVLDSQKVQCVSWMKSIAAEHMISLISDAKGAKSIAHTLEKYFLFHTYVPSGKKELSKIKSIEELEQITRDAIKESDKRDEADTKNSDKYTEYLPVNDPDWEVLIPHAKGAAVEHGKGTEWCTRSPGLEYYEQYHKKDDPLFIFKNKHDPQEKYQFHYGTGQFKDKHDFETEDGKLLLKLHSLLLKVPGLVERYPKIKKLKIRIDDKGNIHEERPSSEWGPEGAIEHRMNGKRHREDGPAIESGDGVKHWYRHGVPHREDGPAIEGHDGHEEWYRNGKRHRDGGPAVTSWEGREKKWYQDGQLHRDDGPAEILMEGAQTWYQHGLPHREDGPAIINPDGSKEWQLHGKRHRVGGPAVIDSSGNKHWYEYGKYVRSDSKPKVHPDGSVEYFSGPDESYIQRPDGTQEWHYKGTLERDNGPAIIKPDGTEEWWSNGDLHNAHGPAIVHPDGSKEWYLYGQRSRWDGPAVVMADGTEEWWGDGKLHREDGPAVIHPNGVKEWWVEGEQREPPAKKGKAAGLVSRYLLKKIGSPSLLATLEGDFSLKNSISRAAQEVYLSWEQDPEEGDPELGFGGICDRVSQAITDVVIHKYPHLDVADGGMDGDDHAFPVFYNDTEAVAVDIPPHVYETGGGYSWKKREGVTIHPDDIVIYEVERKYLVGDY